MTRKGADVAFSISEGTELFLGDPEAGRGLQPSDELMSVVQWMQMN